MNKATLGKAKIVSTIHGTQGTFNKGEVVDIKVKFIVSGNFIIGKGSKAVYATPEELELL